MNTLVLAFRMMLRDLRGGELHLLGLAIVVAVASLVSVGFLADRVERGLDREASQLLGGDLLLRGDRPWGGMFYETARKMNLATTTTVLFNSMLGTDDDVQLVGLKTVQPGYPLRGAVRVAGSPDGPDRATASVPQPGTVWVEARLFPELGLRVGDRVELGDMTFTVAAAITHESDRGSNFFSLMPRVMLNAADLEATGLLVEGSRATWRLHVAGEEEAVSAFENWARPQMGRGQRLETLEDARPDIRKALTQAQRFLRLAALLAVILAAVATGLSARRFLARHLDGCAIMRCLGARHRQLLGVVLGEFLLFGLICALFGSVLGWAVQWGLGSGLRELLAIDLPAPSVAPVWHGLAVGLVLMAGFVLPQLLRLAQVPAVRVLRREFGGRPPLGGALWALGPAVLIGLVFWVAADWRLGVLAALGFSLAIGLFVLVAWGVLVLLGRVRGHGVLRGGGWRYGVASLTRRRAGSVIQIVALGLGMTALLLLTLVRADLDSEWQQMTASDAPNRFILNMQPDQREGVEAAFRQAGLPVPAIWPMVRGRLTAINDRPVRMRDLADERLRRLARREFNLSYGPRLQTGNAIVAGQWHADDTAPQFSVEEGLAKDFGLKLGDRVRFLVAGEEVEAPITSMRRLDWNSRQTNFYFVAPPGVLERFPTSLITSFRLAEPDRAFEASLVRTFPNLTIIDVDKMIEQVKAISDKLVRVVQFIFGFSLLAGLMVLYAALQSTHDEREYEFAVLRTLGARHRQVKQALLAEFLLLGVLAGILAGFAASGIGWTLGRFVFDTPYVPGLLPVLAAAALGGLGVAAAGWLGVRRLLERPPLASLRLLS